MKSVILSIILCLLASPGVFAQANADLTKHQNLENGIAIQGYDPVAYFTKGTAVKGSNQLHFYYAGAEYYFSTSEDLTAFKANPVKYLPQYGGWCAYAMGKTGTKVEIDPETFKIIDGKLYLFYNKYFNNTLKSWNKDEPALKASADVNWQKTVNSTR